MQRPDPVSDPLACSHAPATLENWLATHVTGYRGPAAVSKFAGGQSNPTFRLAAPSGVYVLRRKPLGEVLPSAHAVDREFRVLGALSGTSVPVPRVHALCTNETVAPVEPLAVDHQAHKRLHAGQIDGTAFRRVFLIKRERRENGSGHACLGSVSSLGWPRGMELTAAPPHRPAYHRAPTRITMSYVRHCRGERRLIVTALTFQKGIAQLT